MSWRDVLLPLLSWHQAVLLPLCHCTCGIIPASVVPSCLFQSGAMIMVWTTRLGRSGTDRGRMARWWAAPALGMEKENSSVNPVSHFLIWEVLSSISELFHSLLALPRWLQSISMSDLGFGGIPPAWWLTESNLTGSESIGLTVPCLKK